MHPDALFGPTLDRHAAGESRVRRALGVFCYTSSMVGCLAQLNDDEGLAATPFADDSRFLVLKEVQFCLQVWTTNAINFTIPSTVGKELEHAKVHPVAAIECLTDCQVVLDDLIAARLSVTNPAPRVVQLAEELHLSPKERDAITYILVCHCGRFAFTASSFPLIPSTVARVVGFTPKELLFFLMDTRAHVKQGITSTAQQTLKPSVADSRLTMPIEVVGALTGVDLTDEQLIKLEKTALAKVVERSRRAATTREPEDGSDRDERRDGSARSSYPASSGSVSSSDDEDYAETEFVMDPSDLDGNTKALVEKLLAASTAGGKAQRKKRRGSGGDRGSREEPQNASAPESPTVNGDTKEGLPLTRRRSEQSSSPLGVSPMADVKLTSSKMRQPYTNDIDYIDDHCKALSTTIKLRNTEGDIKDEEESYYQSKSKSEATMRELQGRERVIKATISSRLEATRRGGKWLPRVEIVADKLKLTEFEKQILLLLVGNVISHDVLIAINGRYVMRDGQREMTVGYILFVLCDSLQARVSARKYFYNNASLLKHGIISLSLVQGRHSFNSDLMDYMVDVDRKIVDYLMGEDMDSAELVPGSRLYAPEVPLDKVVLPAATKDAIMSTIDHFDLFAKCKRKCGFSDGLGSQSTGLVFLFYGPSGTGKTMLANAIAHTLKRRLLLVNLVSFKAEGKANDVLRFVFREAKLNDAIIFFDECESFFESRETNPMVTSILSEFEQYDGTIILATNRAQVIDEAMNRRISLMVEFKLPDHSMREQIWREHLPPSLPLDPGVSLEALAMDFELSGGLIRNAALTALSRAVAREKSDAPRIHMEDLVFGARQQLRGLFQAEKTPFGSNAYVTPQRRLEDMVVDPRTRAELLEIAKLVKSRNTLFGHWGFDAQDHKHSLLCLFSGPSGTGKSLAAEAIATECGVPIRLANVSELLLARELSVQTVFEEARKLNAIVVFDSAQRLWDHNERAEQFTQLLLYHAVSYPRPVILLATSVPSAPALDPRVAKLDVKHFIQFQLPDRRLRLQLWRRFIPEQVPQRIEDATLVELAEKPCSAKFIQAACFGACCRAALRHDAQERVLTKDDLLREIEELVAREQRLAVHSHMFA